MFKQIARLHRDEAGNESMQTVMIMAVGALIMLAVSALFKSDIGPKVTQKVSQLITGADIKMGSNP